MIKNIPFTRRLLYIVVLGVIPLFMITLSYMKQKNAWDQVRFEVENSLHQSLTKQKKLAQNTALIRAYQDVDPIFLNHKLETLNFLEREKRALEDLFRTPGYIENGIMKARYDFLCTQNRLQFSELDIQVNQHLRESLESVCHKVEVNQSDLTRILSLIEGENTNSPQLIFTDFELRKKKKSLGTHVFELQFTLLKREFS